MRDLGVRVDPARVPLFHRYVALGDSGTEGIGDDPHPDGSERGWADRLAKVLAERNPDLLYANLAVRGRKVAEVHEQQLAPALALEPDLATVVAGTNDILRRRFDLDASLLHIEAMLRSLCATGSVVVTATFPDLSGLVPAARLVRGRLRMFNEGLRGIAAVTGSLLVEAEEFPVLADPVMWCPDRLHLSPEGHRSLAWATARTLGLAGDSARPAVVAEASARRRRRLQEDLLWGRSFLLPWIGRRLTGRSSGDGRYAKRPDLQPFAADRTCGRTPASAAARPAGSGWPDNGAVTSERRIVVVGGGIVGTCSALFLARAGAGRVTVVERDPTYAAASTTRSAAAIRQQFHLGVNVEMSGFGYEFFTGLASYLPGGGSDIGFVERGYLVLATHEALPRLAAAHQRQVAHGARVVLLDAAALRERFPWLTGDDIGGATFGQRGEGWFDPVRALGAVRGAALAAGAGYAEGEVAGVDVAEGAVSGVRLSSGERLECDVVVNAAGPAASAVAAMVGEPVPVEGRKRTVFLFRPRRRVEDLPNLVDPTVAGRGLYLRPYEDVYMAVTAPAPERDPATTDLQPDHYLFDDVIRGALARRIDGFGEVELVRSWAGHYEMNTFDQNAIVGPHPDVEGFLFACGLSGHGVMHAPAVGRGIAELVVAGRYETIDLSPFAVDRICRGAPLDDVQPSESRKERAGI